MIRDAYICNNIVRFSKNCKRGKPRKGMDELLKYPIIRYNSLRYSWDFGILFMRAWFSIM